MTDPAEALAARIERFEQAADPDLIWDPAALAEAEQAMRACAGDRTDAAAWRLIGMLHLARYRLDRRTTQDAAVSGAFFAAVAVLDPGRLPEKLRGSRPLEESADTWAGLVEEVFRHVDPSAYRHVGLLIHALVRRAMADPVPEVSDRLGQFLLQESMRATDPAWAPGALGLLGAGLVRQYTRGGERHVIADAVHMLLRAALGAHGDTLYAGELAAALGLAAPDDEELVRAYLAAVETPPGGQDRSRALLTLVDLTQARAAASYADEDLLAFIRVGQCALDFWHEPWAHPGVLAPYAAGLIEWFVVTGNESSLEAGLEMLDALHVTPDETARGLGTDPVVRLGLLGDRRWHRYGVTGDPADLDTAISVLRRATDLSTAGRAGMGRSGPGGSGSGGSGPGGHPDRPRLLINLANALLRRAVVTGGDPSEPIAAARAVLAAHDENDPARATALLLLAQALRLDLTMANADEALAALREALGAGERLAFRTEAYGLVSELLCWRATQTDGRRQAEDLREAVLAARQGVELATKASRDQGPAQRKLCRALLARHSAYGNPRDLTEALALADTADLTDLPELTHALDTTLTPPPTPATSGTPTPGTATSGAAAPATATSGIAGPGIATPGAAAPEGASSGAEAPGTAASRTPTCGTAAPGAAAPEVASSGAAAPGIVGPGIVGPGIAGPGAPGTAAPGTPVPDASASAPPAPGAPAPVTAEPVTPKPVNPESVPSRPVTPALDTPAPSTSAPSTPAPSTPAPETPAFGTPALETPAPETSASDTPTPETPSPVTQVPSTPAPPIRPPLVVDEQLAVAATELALRSPDEDLALKLLRLAELRAEGSGERGEFLLGTALRLADAGRPKAAGAVLERAAAAFEAAGLRSRAAYALSRLGAGHEASGESSRALEAYARAAAVYHDLGDPAAEARQFGHMGALHLRTGDPVRAVEHHLRAVAVCEEAGLPEDEARHQDAAAVAHLAAGDPEEAVSCAVRARALHLALGESVAAAKALVHAARAAVDQDDLKASAERMAACAIELEAAGAWEEACAALDAHSVLLSGRGHPGYAAACETRLVEIVRRKGQRREPADEWYRIAQRRRGRGDVDGARVAFDLAEREYEAIGHRDGAGAVRYNLGCLAYAEGDAERALAAFGVAAEAFAGLRARAKEAAAVSMRASCLTALDRAEEASEDLERALELAAAEGDLETLLIATLGRAAVDVELGEFREAGERLQSALGLAGGDALKEAVVHDRLAALAARTGDLGARTRALEAALAGFRDGGRHRSAALASIKLGFALEAQGEFRRARAALEEGLAGLEAAADDDSPPAGAPFEIIAAMAGEMDAAVLSRLAGIQLALGDLTRGRATLTRALASLGTGGRREGSSERLESWLRLAEAESSGDLPTARTLAHHFLTRSSSTASPGSGGWDGDHDLADRSYLLARLSYYCRELGDLPAAYDHALQGYELRDERIVEHLRNLGAAATELGRTEEAATHLSRAVELARDEATAFPAHLVQSLGLLAAALTDLARWSEAARTYEESLALVEAPIWRALRAPLLTGRADLHLKLGELNEAATRYHEAIALGEELAAPPGLAAAYAGLALVHELRGEPTKGRPFADRALTLEREHGRPRGTVLALLALARLERAARREEAAKETEAAREGKAEARPREALSGTAQLERAWLEEALDLPQELGFRAGEAVALVRLGALDLAAVRDPATARTAHAPGTGTHADADAHTATEAPGAGAATGIRVPADSPADADSQARTHAYAAAYRRLSAAIELLTDLGHDLELAPACHHRSIAAEELGDLPAALADAERAHALGHKAAQDRVIRLATHLNQGMTAWTHAEDAKHHTLTTHLAPAHRQPSLSTPVDRPDSEHQPFSPGPLTGYLDSEHRLASPGASAGRPDHGHQPPSPDRPAAHSSPQVWPAPYGVPTELLEAEQRGLEAVRTLMSAARNTRDPERAAHLTRRAHTARADLDDLWRRMEPLAPDHVALRRGTPPSRADLDALVNAPDRRGGPAPRASATSMGVVTALLGFHVGEKTVTVLAHRTGWAEPRAFPTAVDRPLLAEFLRAADGRRPGLLDIEARRHRADLWRRLADLLLSEAVQALGDDVDLLHLIPHAALHRVPLHALAPDGRSLIERFPVTYAPSAAVLSGLTRRAPARGRDSLVLSFTPDAAERPVVESEARDAAALLGTTPRQATTHALARSPQNGSWRVVHLACRAVEDPADPFAAGIRLADGLLTARDLMSMRLDVGLVLVTAREPTHEPTGETAHETARASAQVADQVRDREAAHEAASERGHGVGTHDGLVGLGYGLLHAGAGAVVLSLWPVSAEITRALMRDLHTRLHAGEGPAHALRAAVLGLRELYGSAEPELWASYVLVGLPDGSPAHLDDGMSVTSTR
ncbi:CHAT domain-containing protein [Nonomuraea sp. NPDC048892]|uniref:CHAT domain-containing tetratricopeptide repeat protein n=1 Tax=Nonomuraea sp. NPDC048892 TaxID=3154624 RepID=UPI0033E27EAB